MARTKNMHEAGAAQVEEEVQPRRKSKCLLNKAHVKAYILRMAREHRGSNRFERVSADCYSYLETRLRLIVEDQIKRHPSIGKTLKFQ